MAVATRTDYFDAAMDLLAGEGFAAVKIGTLCSRFGVTVGSFYHHFDNMDAFVDALLAHWEQEQTQRLEDLAAVPPDPVQRVERLKRLTLDLPHAAEAAIRNWAATNQRVDEAQRRVDEHRRRALQRVLEGVVADRRDARHLSVVGMTMLVGVQQWRRPARRAAVRAMLQEFTATIERYSSSSSGSSVNR